MKKKEFEQIIKIKNLLIAIYKNSSNRYWSKTNKVRLERESLMESSIFNITIELQTMLEKYYK